MNYLQMKKEVLNKQIDIDNFPQPNVFQCWDFIFYCAEKYLGGTRVHCGITGYVCDVATQEKTNGILNWCDNVGLNTQLRQGDICIWATGSPDAPLSHIAMYDHDNGPNEVYFLGQNQAGKPYVSVDRISIAGIIAVYRPHAFETSIGTSNEPQSEPQSDNNSTTILNTVPTDFHAEVGTFYPEGTIRIRKAPSLKGVDTGVCYTMGEHVIYDGYVIREGYVWVSWLTAKGHRRWMACGEAKMG